MPDHSPPPQLRRDVSSAERRAIEDRLGPIPDHDLVHAVRDGRGRQFQRLEFLGDSVLDVVLAVHRWVEPACEVCRRNPHHTEASDRSLAQAARRARIGEWLEWQASDDRVADLVETCVAACWFSGGWVQAASFTSAVVHPLGTSTVAALTSGQPGQPGRAARRVGSAVLELSAGRLAFRRRPDADEGELSEARAQVHQAHVIARRALELGEAEGTRFRPGDDDAVLSQVEDVLAATVSRGGVDVALSLAEQFVSPPAG